MNTLWKSIYHAVLFMAIFACLSLTTNPSAYFKAPGKGKVEKGVDADLVVLDGDPADDVRNLAKVAYTIRGGKIIYQEK